MFVYFFEYIKSGMISLFSLYISSFTVQVTLKMTSCWFFPRRVKSTFLQVVDLSQVDLTTFKVGVESDYIGTNDTHNVTYSQRHRLIIIYTFQLRVQYGYGVVRPDMGPVAYPYNYH